MYVAKIVSFVFFLSVVSSTPQRPGLVLTVIKFWSNNNNGTVSKFPPIIEYFVQRIQNQNSNYVHEDESRPPTWEKPVYTLAPEDQYLTADQPVTESVTQPMQTQETTTEDQFEYEELEETTEKFFEIITGNATRMP